MLFSKGVKSFISIKGIRGLKRDYA